MTTKHAPATPLPWHKEYRSDTSYSSDFHWIIGEGGTKVASTCDVERTKKDASYIAHAANAYPKLVEALCKVVAQARMYPDNASAVHADAAILLRSLGEDA